MFEFGCSVANLGATLNARSVSTNWGQGKNIKKSKSFPKQKVAGSNPAREKEKKVLTISIAIDLCRTWWSATWWSSMAANLPDMSQPESSEWQSRQGGWLRQSLSTELDSFDSSPPSSKTRSRSSRTIDSGGKIGDIIKKSWIRIPSGAGHLFNYHLNRASLN